jgi:MFS family permease
MTFKPGGKHIELCQFQHRGPPVFTRNFKLILITNVILSTAMPMLVLLGALAGAALSPVAYAATIPPSVQILAAVLAAAPMSLYMGRVGRKKGFVLAAVLLAAGGLLGVFAMILQHFILLCIAHFVMGAAFVGINSCVLLPQRRCQGVGRRTPFPLPWPRV